MIEIEVHVAKLVQLFNNIDAAPFASRDLDPRAERFIVDSAKDLPRDASFGLAVHVGRTPGDTTFVGEAVHAHFRQQSRRRRGGCASLFRRGRISLAIGLFFLAVALAASKLAEGWLDPGGMLDVAAA